ncbi:MAG: hypothetical protein ABIQ32_08310 [Sphingomicrobium sp.]
MTLAHLLAFLSSLLGFGGEQRSVTRVTMQEEVVVRVPVDPAPHRFEWEEHKGPKCIPTDDIRGAKLSGPQQVDFVLRDRSRIRAKFDDDCPALDFYGGFYLNPQDDNLCVRRDSVHSRMGASCRIDKFKRLTPKLKG